MKKRERMMNDLEQDIREHIETETRDNIGRGMSLVEARYAALRKFGNVTRVTEETREVWTFVWLEQLLQDVRYAIRTLARSPGFAAIVIITLALGIGANTAIFSFIDAVILRPLPVQDPQQLVIFNWSAHERPKYHGHSGYGDCARGVDCSLSLPFFETVRAQANSFSGMAAFAGPLEIDFSGNGPASMVLGEFVSGDYFSTLGVNMFLGRPLSASDDTASAPAAIVLNYGYWQRAFGGDRSALGRTVRLNNALAVIIGVADPRFTNLTPGNPCDFFMPFALSRRVRTEWWGNQDRVSDAGIWWVVIVGRLKPGVSIGQAQAEAGTIFRNELLRGATPMSKEADAPAIKLRPAARGLDGESTQIAPTLYLLMVAVGLVLLIACANVAGLMLARSAARQKEMAVRLALGAGRARIMRQLLTESVLLSFVGGALGIFLSLWGIKAITTLFSSGYEAFPFMIAPDWRVLLYTVCVTLAVGILFGLAPALRGAGIDLTPSLKETASSLPGSAAHRGRWLRLGNALVVAQVALSVVVLIGAGLLVRTLHNLHNLNPGFDTRSILVFGVNPTAAGYTDQKTARLYSDLQQRFAALPGVISASYSADALLSGNHSSGNVHLDGAPPKSNVSVEWLAVGLDFFSTMRIPMLAGRTFTPADFGSAAATNAAVTAAADAPAKETGPSGPLSVNQSEAQAAPVPVIINEAFAREFFPNQDPVGKHMGNAQGDEPATGPQPGYLIVGITGNTKYNNLRLEIEPTMYLPQVSNSAHFELRTTADPLALVKVVNGVVSSVDDNLPLFAVRTQTEQIEQTLFLNRLMSQISSAFALLALVLACIGLYGLLSYEVSRRAREIGIRMALGAKASDVLRAVIAQGITLAAFGVAIGVAIALGITRFLGSLLYNVKAGDPLTFAGVALLLVAVAALACYIPALRAARVDPMVALRYE